MSNPCDDLELYIKLNKSELQFVLYDCAEVQEYQKHQLMRVSMILVFTPTCFLLFFCMWMKCMEHSLFKCTRIGQHFLCMICSQLSALLLFVHSGVHIIICSDNKCGADIPFYNSHIFKSEANLYLCLLQYMSLRKFLLNAYDLFQRIILERFLETL